MRQLSELLVPRRIHGPFADQRAALRPENCGPNRQIGRISAIFQDGVPRTMRLGVAWLRRLPRQNEKSFCREQVEDDQCPVKKPEPASFGWGLIWQAQRDYARLPLVRLPTARTCQRVALLRIFHIWAT